MKRLQIIAIIFFLLSAFALAQTVYVTNTGKKYHKSSCSYLSKSKISISLEDAKSSGYTACKRCKPSSETTYQKSKTKVKPDTTTKEKKKTVTTTKEKTTSSRCLAITKKGTQCKRNSKSGSNYCWQHQ